MTGQPNVDDIVHVIVRLDLCETHVVVEHRNSCLFSSDEFLVSLSYMHAGFSAGSWLLANSVTLGCHGANSRLPRLPRLSLG